MFLNQLANEGRIKFRPLVEDRLPFVGGLGLQLVLHQFAQGRVDGR
jgi:hypothetical protein